MKGAKTPAPESLSFQPFAVIFILSIPSFKSEELNMKYRIFPVIALTLLGASTAYADQCSYSAYVDFGPAMTNGYIDKKELVYRSSGLIKNIRSNDASKDHFAAYTSYKQVKVGEFELINIGPFDSESVAYSELKSVISDLDGKGYKKKTGAHSMPAVLIFNKKPC